MTTTPDPQAFDQPRRSSRDYLITKGRRTESPIDGALPDVTAEMLAKFERRTPEQVLTQRARVEALYAAAAVLGGGPVEGDAALWRAPLVGASAKVLDVARWVLTGLTPAAVDELAEAIAAEPPTAQVQALDEVTAVPVHVDPAALGWGARVIATVTTDDATHHGVRLQVCDTDSQRWRSHPEDWERLSRTWFSDHELSDVAVLDAGEPADVPGGER